MIKIDESIGRPESASQFFAGNDFPGLFQKLGEDLEGLLLQPDLQTLTPQLAGPQIKFEYAEAANSLADDCVQDRLTVPEFVAVSPISPWSPSL